MKNALRNGQSLVLTVLLGGAVACGGTQPGTNTANGQQSMEGTAETTDPESSPESQPSTQPCPDHNDDRICDNFITAGRMTGGGTLLDQDGAKVAHGFELRCDAKDHRQNLTVRWGKGQMFHLESLTMTFCTDLAELKEGAPTAGFDTMIGMGEGRLNGGGTATIQFAFTDAGEPGKSDFAILSIRDGDGQALLTAVGALTGGNHQAHRITPDDMTETGTP
jgi:hypothetical protein